MPQAKHGFGITYCSSANCFFSVGGFSSPIWRMFSKVTVYSLERNKWSQLPPFPKGIGYNSVCVLKETWLYNLGGYGIDWIAARLRLSGKGRADSGLPQWQEVLLKYKLLSAGWQSYGIHVIKD